MCSLGRTMTSLGHDQNLLLGVSVENFVSQRTTRIRPGRTCVVLHTRRKCPVPENVKRQNTGNAFYDFVPSTYRREGAEFRSYCVIQGAPSSSSFDVPLKFVGAFSFCGRGSG
jgi:hypothetical protein